MIITYLNNIMCLLLNSVYGDLTDGTATSCPGTATSCPGTATSCPGMATSCPGMAASSPTSLPSAFLIFILLNICIQTTNNRGQRSHTPINPGTDRHHLTQHLQGGITLHYIVSHALINPVYLHPSFESSLSSLSLFSWS